MSRFVLDFIGIIVSLLLLTVALSALLERWWKS